MPNLLSTGGKKKKLKQINLHLITRICKNENVLMANGSQLHRNILGKWCLLVNQYNRTYKIISSDPPARQKQRNL